MPQILIQSLFLAPDTAEGARRRAESKEFSVLVVLTCKILKNKNSLRKYCKENKYRYCLLSGNELFQYSAVIAQFTNLILPTMLVANWIGQEPDQIQWLGLVLTLWGNLALFLMYGLITQEHPVLSDLVLTQYGLGPDSWNELSPWIEDHCNSSKWGNLGSYTVSEAEN